MLISHQVSDKARAKGMAMASISMQKPVTKNNDNGQGKYSCKGLSLIRNRLSRSCQRIFSSEWLP